MPTKEINLVPEKEFGKLSAREKAFDWTVKYGRTIVIIVQGLVICLLFYKLALSDQLSKVSDNVEKKSSIVASFSSTEKELSDIQKRIELLKGVKRDLFKPSAYAKIIARDVPKDISLDTVILQPNLIQLNAKSSNITSFGQMIQSMDSDSELGRVDLLGAHLNPSENTFTFDIEIETKKL